VHKQWCGQGGGFVLASFMPKPKAKALGQQYKSQTPAVVTRAWDLEYSTVKCHRTLQHVLAPLGPKLPTRSPATDQNDVMRVSE
jgi:hypothetical protein